MLDVLGGVSGVDSAPLTAVDLLVFIYAIAQAWYLTPTGLLRADGSDPHRIADHRASIVATVTRFARPIG